MRNTLWSVEFGSNVGYVDRGVVVFTKKRVCGGGPTRYFVGKYKEKKGVLQMSVSVTDHSKQPKSEYAGTRKNYHLELHGKVREPDMKLQGHLVEDPKQIVVFRLHKRADL